MTHPEPFIRSIPLNRLELAQENVRKTPADPAALEELKASIAAHGLLENLIVRIEDTGHDPGSGPEQAHVDRCAVVAGGRRLAAMKALAEEGILNADHPVPCRVIGAAENPGELSLAENVVRVAMHPADQVVAFLKLSDAGVTVAAIAARFGVTERLVEQRLSLGGVAPELLDAYRAQEMDLDTLKAFTVTIDHARQKAVWEQVKEQGYGPSGWQVKRMLTEESVPAASAVARFVGMEAYEAAGGTLTRDLFAGEDGSETWFDDPVLLNELATEKLRAAADDLTTRWKWAKTMVEADWSAVAGFGRISPEPGVPTEEEKAERESLRARHDELVNMDEDEWPDELIEEAEAIKSRLHAIEEVVESRAAFREQDFAIAGCIATVGHDGALKVIKGLVRPEDMPERTGAGGEDNRTEPGRMDAPLITEPLATPPDPRARAREETGIGIGLADDLRAVRTTLVKAHLSQDFEAAFDLTLFQLARAAFTVGYRADALDIAVRETADRPPARVNDEDFAAWSPGEAMLTERSGLSLDWMKDEDDAAAFAAMRALPEADKQALFAAAVSRTIKGLLAFEPGAWPELEATIARLDIDFARHVRPGAAMLWSRIRKDRILTIARATLGPVWASSRAKFKKADLARAMEEAFAADPPDGLNPRARAAALAWTPPGFAPFDTGRMEEAEGEEDIPPAGESESDNAETVDEETPDAACGEAPARGELARAVDALNAVPTADGGPRVIVHQGGIVNGHEGGGDFDIPEFLRGA